MPKQTKKGTKVIGINTTKNKTRRRTRKAGKEASTCITDSSENPKEVMHSEMRATNSHGLLGTREGIIGSFAFSFRCSKHIVHLDTVSVFGSSFLASRVYLLLAAWTFQSPCDPGVSSPAFPFSWREESQFFHS